MKRRWKTTIALAALCVLLLSGCVQTGPAKSADPFTKSAIKYGLAPMEDAGTTFQSDVVIVGGGGASVVGETADGLTWYLDPNAPRANELAVGKVMFVTGRGVGRVVDIRHKAGTLAVTIAPVSITDVIRDGDFATDHPVAMNKVVVQVTPKAFWADPDVLNADGPQTTAEFSGSTSGGHASATPPIASLARLDAVPPIPVPNLPRPRMPEPTIGSIAKVTSGAFNIKATCCSDGVGATFSYDKNGIRANGALALKIKKPDAQFNLTVVAGKVTGAEFLLKGAASLHAELNVGSADGHPYRGTSQPLGADMDFSIPIGTILGVPFSVTVSQLFVVMVNIPGDAKLTGVGDYKIGGQLGFKYDGHKLTNGASASFDANTAISGSSSLAVGVSSASLDYQVKFTVGIGAFGFVAGLEFEFASHINLTYGAPVGFNLDDNTIEQCKSAQGQLDVVYGVGYKLPKFLAQVVNFFLKYFNSDPIPASGGIHAVSNVANTYAVYPSNALCK